MKTRTTLNIPRLIKDFGGFRRVAEICGVSRPAPYRWARTGYIANQHLEALKNEHPEIDLDQYFDREEVENGDDT